MGKLGAVFYPKGTEENPIPFESLYLPFIWKEIYFDGLYVDIFNENKDMVVIDIGSNVGLVTQYMRERCKKVYAIEPSSEHFEALKQNKEFNKWDNVEVFNLAIAGKDGEVIMHKNDGNRTCNSYVLEYRGEAQPVKAQTIETFMKENNIEEVDFIKLDVEGAEDDILRTESFKRVAPKIKAIEIEFHFPNWPNLVEYLQSLGYTARRYDCSAIVLLFTR